MEVGYRTFLASAYNSLLLLDVEHTRWLRPSVRIGGKSAEQTSTSNQIRANIRASANLFHFKLLLCFLIFFAHWPRRRSSALSSKHGKSLTLLFSPLRQVHTSGVDTRVQIRPSPPDPTQTQNDRGFQVFNFAFSPQGSFKVSPLNSCTCGLRLCHELPTSDTNKGRYLRLSSELTAERGRTFMSFSFVCHAPNAASEMTTVYDMTLILRKEVDV